MAIVVGKVAKAPKAPKAAPVEAGVDPAILLDQALDDLAADLRPQSPNTSDLLAIAAQEAA